MNPNDAPAAVEVDVMVTAWLRMPHGYVFRADGGNRVTQALGVVRPGGETLRAPCLAYVVRHPTAGTILVDTGFHPDARESLRADFGARMALVFRGLDHPGQSYEEQLRDRGVEPTEVERVVMTHLHVDHTSGMRLLPNARFVCSREEWRAATGRGAGGRGYVAGHLPAEERMDLVDLEARGEPHGPFATTIDLLGDGSIRLISTPGHTRGHMSLLLRVAGDRQVLIVGDAVYTLRSMREEILPMLTYGDDVYLRSLRELKAFAEQEPDAILVPTHDPEAWRELTADRGAAATAESA